MSSSDRIAARGGQYDWEEVHSTWESLERQVQSYTRLVVSIFMFTQLHIIISNIGKSYDDGCPKE